MTRFDFLNYTLFLLRRELHAFVRKARANKHLIALYNYYITHCQTLQPFSFFILMLYHTIINKSRRSLVYHPQLVAVYHQCEALYIIKPQEDARWRVMRYSPKGADDIHDCVVMIYQACGLDKQKQNICR